MSGFDVVVIIAIILCARLAIRLVSRYLKIKNQDQSSNDKESS